MANYLDKGTDFSQNSAPLSGFGTFDNVSFADRLDSPASDERDRRIATINTLTLEGIKMFGQAAMYILSFFVICLGGVSLLIQKIYKLDEKGGETVIDLPFIGRLTTNVPALAFVFIGAAMAIFTFSRVSSLAGSEKWFVTGQFTPPPSTNVDWTSGSVSVDPKAFETSIHGDGTFVIQGDLKNGETFEDAVKQITYQNQHFLGAILVEAAYNDYKKKQPDSILKSMTDTGRTYKPVEVNAVDLQH